MRFISGQIRNLQKRCFQTRADYEKWSSRMRETSMALPSGNTGTAVLSRLQRVHARVEAPFLYSVSPISDRLRIFANSGNNAQSSSPYTSMLECMYPLSGIDHDGDRIPTDDLDILRASISDFDSWSSFRLAKFYSDVDALTADVAYRHASSAPEADNIAFVTAGHYNSRKIHRTDVSKDIILRCYPTYVGGSSMEIRTDAIQTTEDINGAQVENLINVCFTCMVAVDKTTLRPMKNVIPKLSTSITIEDSNEEHNDPEQDILQMRVEMAEQHNQIRKERFASSMQLRGQLSSPPTQEEMFTIHALHQQILKGEEDLPRVTQHTYKSSVVVYPEKKNVNGKLFGGFVMEQGHILAQYAADFYLHHHKSDKSSANATTTKTSRAIPLGLDEAIFLQPVSIGDHVTFEARVVHSTHRTCRVVVTVEVREPSDRHSVPLRSNRLSFLFGGAEFPSQIVPDTYSEILMHVDAGRRSAVEGPMDEEVDLILSEKSLKEQANQ